MSCRKALGSQGGGGEETMRIGVLALQGDFEEHCTVLTRLGVEVAGGPVTSALGKAEWTDYPWGRKHHYREAR